ncbi:MAG: enoyl-CoA hydratase-related protein [Planctomycetota bacterium]
MEAKNTLFEIQNGIGILTLNRPEVRNAIDRQMVQEIHEILDSIESLSDLKVLVICGKGEKAFAAGADIAQLRDRNYWDALQGINSALFQRIEDCRVPVIAAIQGYALGGGCELALACDIRICGKSSKFGQPEVTLGIIPGAGACHRLARLVGLGKAKELVFTGDLIGADDAYALGLVNYVVEDGQALPEALKLAQKIAQNGALAVQLAKSTINAIGRPGQDIAFHLERFGQAILFDSDEKKKRMTDFLEKKQKK